MVDVGREHREAAVATPPNRNPDRDFSTEEGWEPDAESLRALLRRGEVADISDPDIEERIGRAIARAGFDPRRQRW